MTLVIRDFRPAQDKGAYVCRAANSLGDAESSIQVYGSFHFIFDSYIIMTLAAYK